MGFKEATTVGKRGGRAVILSKMKFFYRGKPPRFYEK